MNPNYSRILEKEIQRLDESGIKPRLLLHSCCAPCSSYVMEYLREHFRITVFYYNPNITSKEEYDYRLSEEKRLIEAYNRQVETQDFEGMNSTPKAEKIEILECPYDPENYLKAVKGYENCPEGGDRCGICFEMRLRKTAEAAREGGYDCFTTTKRTGLRDPLNCPHSLISTDRITADAAFRKDKRRKQIFNYSIDKENTVEKFLNLISAEMAGAFDAAGYDSELGKVTVSNRPDLCEYQCNGAMAGAKRYHKAPLMIANDVAARLQDSRVFSSAEAVKPGFLNLKIREEFLTSYLNEMSGAEKFGLETPEKPASIILDYGGPNVAKPLHVGHLRSAVIGEAVKRIARYHGEKVIGDIHLGDWGLQMGLVITEVSKRQPDLCYFDPSYEGEYPEEAPFTVSELEEIYPTASKKSKEDPEYYAEAMANTHRLQEGDRGLRALWNKIIEVSVADMKKNYANLDVDFDLWWGESTVHDAIPGMVADMKDKGLAYESNGALVVDVSEESDTKEIPPCIILKSDGAALYTTTDLATISERERLYHPDQIIYITDKRQELHFQQVFRTARKCGLVDENTQLRHIGFGTMNGRDGKPFKTRDGGVMKLSDLISDINTEMRGKIASNPEIGPEEAEKTAKQVALAALKYGDLSNQASKDYIFDIERFTSFEGDTGPYILYTIVRIKSILGKYAASGGRDLSELRIGLAQSKAEKDLMTDLAGFGAMMDNAYTEIAPHRVCAYIYQLSNDFNSFYHSTKILSEQDQEKKESWIALLKLTLDILSACIDVLGFSAPERM